VLLQFLILIFARWRWQSIMSYFLAVDLQLTREGVISKALPFQGSGLKHGQLRESGKT